MAVSNDPEAILVAPSLGASLAVGIYDRNVSVGGLLVTTFPRTAILSEPAESEPLLGANSGLIQLFRQVLAAGAKRDDLLTYLAGVGQFMEAPKPLDPGPQLYRFIRGILKKNKVRVSGQHVGGPVNRSLRMNVRTGEVTVTIGGTREVVL